MTVQITKNEIERRFGYHKAVFGPDGTAERHQRTRKRFIELAEYVVSATDSSREQSLALTALQEACQWTNAAIAMDAPLTKEE